MIRTFFDKGGMSIATIIQDLDHGDNLYIYVHLSLHLELFLLCIHLGKFKILLS